MQDHHTIIDMFDQACQQYHALPAFSCLDYTMSYGELDTLSRQFATYLQHHTPLSPGDRLAIQLPNILQYPVVLFGAIRAGVIVVNTNPLYTGVELCHQLNNSGAKVLVVLANVAKTIESVLNQTDIQQVIVTEVGDLHPFPKRQLINSVVKYVKKQVPKCHFPCVIRFRESLALGKRDTFSEVKPQASDIAFLQYTGGTTGVAKGAMLTHANLVSNKTQMLDHWNGFLAEQEELFVAPLPLYHIYGFTLHCMVIFSIGGHNVLVPNPRDIDNLVKVFKNYPLTGAVGLNTLFVALLGHPAFTRLDFSCLKFTSSGGMALPEETALHWQRVVGNLPIEGYGLTETSPIVAANVSGSVQLGTIGRPIPRTETKVIDSEGNTLLMGEEGELCVRGPQVMSGYWNSPEATAEVLDNDGWLRTGDIAIIQADGYIKIIDRKKDMIIVSGFNVYPSEVEGVLLRHPDILEAAVIGIKDENGGETLKAFLVVTSESDTSDEAIKAFCRESLTSYKLPRFYEFRSELPKTNVGKVLRRELKAKAE